MFSVYLRNSHTFSFIRFIVTSVLNPDETLNILCISVESTVWHWKMIVCRVQAVSIDTLVLLGFIIGHTNVALPDHRYATVASSLWAISWMRHTCPLTKYHSKYHTSRSLRRCSQVAGINSDYRARKLKWTVLHRRYYPLHFNYEEHHVPYYKFNISTTFCGSGDATSAQEGIFCRLVSIYQYFWPYFHCACAENCYF